MRRLLALLALLPLAACGAPGYAAAPPVYGDAGIDEVIVLPQESMLRGVRSAVPASERQVVRDATLAVEVGDGAVEATLADAVALAESLGGYATWEGPGAVVLRIPDARLDEALDGLAALGDVERREVRSTDVTAVYTDLELRLTTARALQTRLQALLEEAETVQDVLAVETELARVTVEVEGLEGRMRLLQNQVAFSTVRFSASESVRPGPLGWVVVGAYEAVKWLFVWD